MNWTLDVVVVPVSDIDRAEDLYHQTDVGFGWSVRQISTHP
ncbi:hypothetical protein [Nocardia pseudobrasiliensis]|uniref:Uncharacterized protein n=1 Tax=Nocardia pseudobrasiliensis TaxID=45979 RepID=A0A370HMA9_9NOCA|nr:hypothetical protein [Nocardia pseudobrasiliensis]RDI59703.1 hypothetical protein DFR76_11734 [Nocardia pseudobrasiliensis]